MIMPEILKKLCELQLNLRDNGGAKIHDISMLQDGEYGYVFAMTTCKGNVHDELLSAKLAELKGKQLMPDLWMFGPCLKQAEQKAT
jgi:hypothetical protein